MRHRLGVFAAAALLAATVPGCGEPTRPCGTFTFTGAPHAEAGIDLTLEFAFDPESCGAPASTGETVAYIQIVRIIDVGTGQFMWPNSEQGRRTVTGRPTRGLNGWAVDRLESQIWGYYGRNDDGSFADRLTPGDDTRTAVLRDRPAYIPVGWLFDAVSVPTCIAGDACLDRLAGYYLWLFSVSQDGRGTDPSDQVATEPYTEVVEQAVIEWNNDAAELGKNPFPPLRRLP